MAVFKFSAVSNQLSVRKEISPREIAKNTKEKLHALHGKKSIFVIYVFFVVNFQVFSGSIISSHAASVNGLSFGESIAAGSKTVSPDSTGVTGSISPLC